MFTTVSAQVASRYVTIDRVARHLQQIEAYDTGLALIAKGMAFVQMYALYEFSVRAAVQAMLSCIKAGSMHDGQLKREVLCLVLEPQWKSAKDAGRKRVWQCRVDLVRTMSSPTLASEIDDTIFPDDGSHYRVRQLETIWTLFGVTEPVVPDQRLLGRIEELVENRNAVAHGRRTPEDVGRSYSWQDIQSRCGDTRLICEHVVRTLEAHFHAGGLRLV